MTDIGSGVRNVTLWYNLNNGTEWTSLDMNETLPNTFSATLSGYEYSLIAYKIAAYDKTGNNATKDNHGDYYRYNVVPELVPNMPSVPLMILSALASIFIRIFLILTFLMVRTLLR